MTPDELEESVHKFAKGFKEFVQREAALMDEQANAQTERITKLHDEICPEPKDKHDKCVDFFVHTVLFALAQELEHIQRTDRERKAKLN